MRLPSSFRSSFPRPLASIRRPPHAWTSYSGYRHTHQVGGPDQNHEPLMSKEKTPLQKLVLGSIQAKGPITVSEYMTMCLSHPTEGYYMKGDPIGAKGDFITSPEISQVFGELLAIWLVSQWIAHGKGRDIRLIELGPGRGTLMDDMLRTFASIGQTRDRIRAVHLIETSARLREEQRDKLSARLGGMRILHWNDRLDELAPSEDMFTVIIAHEFFDAIPIHIIEKSQKGFQEVLVGINKTAQDMDTVSASALEKQPSSDFRYVLSGNASPLANIIGQSTSRFANLPVGSRIEVSTASWSIARTAGQLIGAPGGGAGLVVDYGDDRAFGSSFRAFQKHDVVDVFHQPGWCDLTANVDFAYLKEAMATTPTTCHGPITQQAFLTNMGASIRLKRILESATDKDRRVLLEKGAQRLMDPLGMGSQYKILGMTSNPEATYPFST